MSSEDAASASPAERSPRADAREHAARRRFRRGLAIAVAALVVLVGVLATLGALAPPRLSSASIDPGAATERPGQRLVLSLSQPVDPGGATVVVQPETPTELVVDGATATVRFTGMLDYATEYAVRVEGLRGSATGAVGAVETRFTTPDPGIVTLIRGDEGDRLVRSPIAGVGSEELAAADSIGDLAVAGDAIAYTAQREGGGGAVVRIAAGGAPAVDAVGPREATIRSLRGTDAGLFGWIISRGADGEREYQNVLVVLDLAAGSRVPVEITAPGGAPLLAVDWAWVPGTTSLVVQDQGGFTWLADPLGGEPTLLGGQGTLRGFVPGTAMLLTEDGPDLLVSDLAAGATSTFGLVAPEVGADDVAGESAALSLNASAWIVHRFDRTRTPSIVGSSIVRVDAEGTTELYRTPGEDSIVLDLCVSPNGQYVAAVVAGTSGDAVRPTTVLIDARTGGTSRSVPGGSPSWCD